MKGSKRHDRVYLQDILSAAARIGEYTAKGKAEFFVNGLVQDGVIRQFSVIGEAAAKLPAATRTKYPGIPWKKIIGMRNIIIHDYSEIDLPTVWDAVEQDVPVLKTTIETILRDLVA